MNVNVILFSVLQSFNTLHMMYHEATACHVTGDLVELLSIFLSVLKASRPYLQRKGPPRPLTPHLKVVVFVPSDLMFLRLQM